MALTVTHPFVSAVVDENNPGEVGPDEWNAAHSIGGTLDAAQMPSLMGDVTTPGASLATTLATVNGNVGTFGSATQVAQVTYNAKGLATAITNVTVTPAASSVTGGAALTKTDDTNVTLTLGGSPTTALLAATSITVGWTGTVAAARLNGNVVQSVVNDTNVTGSISAQALTLGWTGTTSPARGGTGVANNAASTITISGNFGTTFTVTATTSVTLPTTGTLATLAGSEILTNKTLTSPILTTPQLGTPASGNLANCTGVVLTLNSLTGAVALRPPGVTNGKITEANAANAATFHLKTLAGTDPSASDPVLVTLSDGTTGSITAALSVTVSSGSTLGTANSTPFRVWIVLINDGGTWRLGVRQCTSSAGVNGFPGNGLLSSTAEGGAGAADSAGVTYTGTAVTAKPFVIVAAAEYDSGLATAGTWASSPTRLYEYVPGMPRPGDDIQTQIGTHATSESTASTSLTDTSLTKAITPTSACNPVVATFFATNGQSTASKWAFYVVRRGGVAIGTESGIFNAGGIFVNKMTESVFDRPGSAAAQTYTLAYRTDSGGDAFLCTSNLGSSLVLTEKMG